MSYEYALDSLNSRALAMENQRAGLLESEEFYSLTSAAVAVTLQSHSTTSEVAYVQERWEQPGNDAARMMPEQAS